MIAEPVGHASHEACELKFRFYLVKAQVFRHASHEACELKFKYPHAQSLSIAVTPRMRRVS